MSYNSGNSSSCLSGAAPMILASGYLCNPGFFCPNNSDTNPPEYCPPTPICQITRLLPFHNTCPVAQGTYEPLVCPPGRYCGSDGGKEMNICPQGSFCPLGTAEPFQCRPASICPEGSQREVVMDGFIIIFVFDSLIILLFLRPVRWALRKLLRAALIRTGKLRHGYLPGWMSDLAAQEGGIAGRGPDEPIQGTESSGTPSTREVDDVPLNESAQKFVESVNQAVETRDIGLSFGFQDLSLTLKNGKRILAPQSGMLEKGSFWGVLGASGAGKSTFVNVLMGKTTQTTGTTLVNGTPISISKLKKFIGYVPQDDVLTPELTVRENIMFSAKMRLSSAWSEQACRNHVDTLIACLGLSHVQHNRVGDHIKSAISGGQRKRVSIGIELAAAPMALFLDEPTSGLDATAALSIMRLLKTLSQLGSTVICIIHQPRPEILDFLDGIHLLGDGYQIYQGHARGVSTYFDSLGFNVSSSHNVADAVLDILSGHSAMYSKTHRNVTVEELANHWMARSRMRDAIPSPVSRLPPSAAHEMDKLLQSAAKRGAPWHRQVWLCFERSIKQDIRQKSGFLLEISVGALAGMLIGLALYSLQGQHFQGIFLFPFELLSSSANYTLVPEIGLLCNLAIGLAAAPAGVKTFGEEKQLYWREASAGHSRSAYYIGKVIATFPRLALSAIHFTSFYCVLAFPLMPFWDMYVINLMYFYCIYGFASIVSTVVRRENGALLAMIVCLIIGVFNGYGPPLRDVSDWHLGWFWRIWPGFWLTEAYFEKHIYRLAYLYDLQLAYHWTEYVPGRFGLDVALLGILGTIYRGIAFAGLTLLNRSKQR